MRKRVKGAPLPPERDLAAAWAAAPAAPLTTTDGARVRVLYPGRRNRAAGPDFLDAVLGTDAGEVRGAVEVHRRASDWTRHGHGADARYAGVVLHVVGRADGGGGRLPGGAPLPLLELDPAGWAAGGGSPRPLPCAAAIAAGADPLPALLAAGEARFTAAAARLERAFRVRAAAGAGSPGGPAVGGSADRWEQLAYEHVAAALGYSRNVEPMQELAAAVPLDEVRRLAAGTGSEPAALRAEAVLIGAAGLLPAQRHLPAVRRRGPYAAALERAWQALGRAPALRAYRWGAVQVRPENAPVRRVVALAHLALRWPAPGLLARVGDCLRRPAARATRDLAALVAVPCPASYWATHWDFGVPARPARPTGPARPAPGAGGVQHAPRQASGGTGDTAALVGAARAADVVVNVLLPLAAAAGAVEGDAGLVGRARAAYEAHGLLAENWITRLVRERAGLAAGRGDRVRGARAQQGLLALYEGPCHALRCGECPLGTPTAGGGRPPAGT